MKKAVIFVLYFLILQAGAASAANYYSPFTSWAVQYAANNESKLKDPYTGWHVLSDDYAQPNILDGLSLEWDYYAFTNLDGKFTGTIGITINDPRAHLGNDSGWIAPGVVPALQPSGGNAAIIGRFADGQSKRNFCISAFLTARQKKPAKTCAHSTAQWTTAAGYSRQYPLPDGAGGYAGIKLEGESPTMQWDLTVTPLWPERIADRGKTWRIGDDVGMLPAEHFTVNSIWLSHTGTGHHNPKNLHETIAIDAIGYREDSFGRYAFINGGWDFTFGLDPVSKTEFMIQTFYPFQKSLILCTWSSSRTGRMFSVNSELTKGSSGGITLKWHWDETAKICHPSTTAITAEDSDYMVEITVAIERKYAPILSDITVMTHLYVITELMPAFSGTVKEKATGKSWRF